MNKDIEKLEDMLKDLEFSPTDRQKQTIYNKIIDKKTVMMKSKKPRLTFTLSTAALTAMIILIFSATTITVYAIVGQLLNKADPGGSYEIVIVEDEKDIDIISKKTEEIKETVNKVYLTIHFLDGELIDEDGYFINETEETIELIKESIRNEFYNENGELIKRELTSLGYGYGSDIPESLAAAIKNLNIEVELEIKSSYYDPRNNELILDFGKKHFEAVTGIVSTYEEAKVLFGQDFQIPDIDGFYPKSFEISDQREFFDKWAMYVIYTKTDGDIEQEINYFVELANDSFDKNEWRVTGTIEEYEINGVTIYRQIDANGERGRNMWQYDNLSYCLFYSEKYNLDEDTYIEVINSMLK